MQRPAHRSRRPVLHRHRATSDGRHAVAHRAVERAREEGLRVGMLRLITVWPFPEQEIRKMAGRVNAFVVPEINYGQVSLEVERCAGGAARTVLVPHLGGSVHHPETILKAIRKAAG